MTPSKSLLTHAQAASYRTLKRSKGRKESGLFLLEGVRLCQESMSSDLEIIACITTKDFQGLNIPDSVPHFEATPVQVQQISDSKSPQGVLCVARIPKTASTPSPEEIKTLLVLDRIADPGNMGTIFRSALWFGVTDILLGPDCVDPYSPKVVRSSMGSIGTLRLYASEDLVHSAESWLGLGGDLAALHMNGTPLQDFKPTKALFLVVGSEAHGVEPTLLSLTRNLAIGRPGSGESLNAAMATGIALFQLTKP